MLKKVVFYFMFLLELFGCSDFKITRSKLTIGRIVNPQAGINYLYTKNGTTIDYLSTIRYMINIKGKDSIYRRVIVLHNDTLYNNSYFGEYFYLRYDTLNPNKIIILTSEPILDNSLKIDTVIGEITNITHRHGLFEKASVLPGITFHYFNKDSNKLSEQNIAAFLEPFEQLSSQFSVGLLAQLATLYTIYPEIQKNRKYILKFEKGGHNRVFMDIEHPADSNTFHFHPDNNLITIDAIPYWRTGLSYEHVLSYSFSAGIKWSYYYPVSNLTSNEVKNFNRIDPGIKLYALKAPEWFYLEAFGSFAWATTAKMNYFNSPYYSETSVSSFLAANPSNKVYVNEPDFTTWGFGGGVGTRQFLDGKYHFMIGADIGYQYLNLPSLTQQTINVAGITYYYHDFPNWTTLFNYHLYGNLILSYKF